MDQRQSPAQRRRAQRGIGWPAGFAERHPAPRKDAPARNSTLETDHIPLASPFTPAERALVGRLRTPQAVQRFLNALPYNTEPPPGRATLRSFRGVVRHGTAHCLEAALAAAVLLEQHGYPPLVLSLESIDQLDHVIFVYRRAGRWGAIGRSRDPGLHGRRAVFATPRALALSYVDPFVDFSGRITGYAVYDLRRLGTYDWRLADTNVWKVERVLLEAPHRPIRSSDRRITRLRAWYRAFRTAFPTRRPVHYRGRDRWSELPSEFRYPGPPVRAGQRISPDRSRGSAG